MRASLLAVLGAVLVAGCTSPSSDTTPASPLAPPVQHRAALGPDGVDATWSFDGPGWASLSIDQQGSRNQSAQLVVRWTNSTGADTFWFVFDPASDAPVDEPFLTNAQVVPNGYQSVLSFHGATTGGTMTVVMVTTGAIDAELTLALGDQAPPRAPGSTWLHGPLQPTPASGLPTAIVAGTTSFTQGAAGVSILGLRQSFPAGAGAQVAQPRFTFPSGASVGTSSMTLVPPSTVTPGMERATVFGWFSLCEVAGTATIDQAEAPVGAVPTPFDLALDGDAFEANPSAPCAKT